MSVVKSCPGLYCGRTDLGNGVWSECGACPRGFRTNDSSYCTPCTEEPSLYDWQYLGFMVLLPLVLHWFFIDMVAIGKSKSGVIAQHICAFTEVVTGTLAALLVLPPTGSIALFVCTPKALSDWYTLLHNPQPDYKETLHCTQEAVYPLYTIVLLIYAFSLLMTILLRPWILTWYTLNPGKKAIYCALYFYPILVLIHTVAAGLIYCSFPYIVIIISMMTSASHFSIKLDQSAPALLKSSISNTRNLVILIGHWLVHAYGILSLTGFKELWYLSLVPAPALFYILTAQFTDPMKLHND
ncbi:JNK1/MAPK8-associated membrane protein [Papilio machaon]|uniref:JNK1/MAPK8-associated membrane protein n=1 Tax=Papilio machaon TaxID=76193 RepID=A0A194RKV8_PAPMA|nr:JNK1/MAPK8-associated membrane protein [Papilio machaon]KPJ18177.1 JNK1/MAPK8-associated membrane protein [Papilio machaon]